MNQHAGLILLLYIFNCHAQLSDNFERFLSINNGVQNADGSYIRGLYQYWILEGNRTFDEAESECKTRGVLSHLVSIDDAKENLFVSGLLGNRSGVSWWDPKTWVYIGARRNGTDWKWSDEGDFRYSNWKSGENNVSGNDCVALIPGEDIENGLHSRWMQINCSAFTRYSICKSWNVHFGSAQNTDGSYSRGLRQYWILEGNRTFDEAETECSTKGYGSHLVSIHDERENLFVSGLLGNRSDVSWWNRETWVHIGARRDNSYSWMWSDGSNFKYNNWKPREANDLEKRCMAMIPGENIENDVHSRWMQINCSLLIRYSICKSWNVDFGKKVVMEMARVVQKKPEKFKEVAKQVENIVRYSDDELRHFLDRIETMLELLIAEFKCEEGWIRYRDDCFLIVNTTATYYDAKTHCAFVNATLPSVHSMEKNNFLAEIGEKVLNASIWLGARREASTRKFTTFDDGTDFDFRHWTASRAYQTGDCLSITRFCDQWQQCKQHWTAEDCLSATRKSVCQRKL